MMIYDLLASYKDYLLETYRPSTAGTYYKRLCTLLADQSLSDTTNRLDIEKVFDKLGTIKHRNYFSQSKNAFLHFCEFQNISLSSDTLESIKILEEATRKKYRKFEPIEYSQIHTRIKHIKNKKLKLCYQVIIATGLRVSELASIFPSDCIVTDDKIIFHFTGKGGKRETATLQAVEYPSLYQRGKEHIQNTSQGKKLFYSANYLQTKAKELGFKCHDLRRVYAKVEYKKCRSKSQVMKKMRHSSIKNTNIYLRSKVKI